MIGQVAVVSIVDDFLTPLGQFAAFFLVILGFFWLVFAGYEANRRKSWRKLTNIDDWDFAITAFLKILTYCGFIVGIISIIIGAAGLILDLPPSIAYEVTSGNEGVHMFTSIFLVVLGILTFLKPLNDLPIASVAALLVSTAVCIAIALLIPEKAVEIVGGFVDPRIVLVIIFAILFAIVGLTVKFYIAGLMALSKIISWPPLAFIVSIVCFIQGFALLVLGSSLFF